jgi:type II secretory pathway pseudopilin PulG
MPRIRRGAESGLTLVEMLISIALLAFILLGIAPLFIASVRSNYTANEYTSIHNLARDRLEQLMNLPIADAQLSAATATFPNDLPPFLPDPKTGVPPTTGGVRNTFVRTYTVTHWRIPADDLVTVPNGGVFTPIAVGAGLPYDIKRIDVTVESTGATLGSGARVARVTAYRPNPDPDANVL